MAIGQMEKRQEDYNRRRTSSPGFWESAGSGAGFFEVDLEEEIIFCSVPMVSAICLLEDRSTS